MNKSKNTTPKEKKYGYYQKDGKGETIYIGNLSYAKSEMQIKELFEKYGQVKYVKVITDNTTGNSKGIAFVQMPNKLEATKAIKSLNNTALDGRTLKVSVAVQRESDKVSKKPKSSKLQSQDIEEESVIKPKKKKKRTKGLALLFENLKK